MELFDLTIHEAGDLLRARQVSSVELTRAALERIDRVEERVKAFVTLTPELALAQAQDADGRLRAGDATRLTGVPGVIKDVICTQGVRTTCSSRMLENFVPPYDATVVRRLKDAGLVMLGKANMDEFAMGSSTENSAFHTTHNPWDLARVPGGSSGGSAAAMAAGEGIWSLGSDTGGSIRQPAGFCNVVGLDPTYGRVSRFGLVAFASSLDQVGPITKDVTDCAMVLNIIAGHDPQDSTTHPVPVPDYTRALRPDPSAGSGQVLKGMRVGVPKEYFVKEMDQRVADVVRRAVQQMEALGAQVDWEVSLPHTEYALAVYYLIAPSECSANLARYDGVKYGYSDRSADNMWQAMERTRAAGFGPEVKRRIMLGTYALSAGYYDAYYLKALKVRTLIRRDFEEAFKNHDVLVTPTSPTMPFKIGERTQDPVQMYLADIFTLPASVAGLPGLTVPAGFVDGQPVGIQILARPFAEETVLRVGYTYEQTQDWHRRRPKL
ncbi:MAG: Asp-tRNA(Asn)/Glu-tRNA(Gln) amidotransferase subunit GatA [Dehalococcoidia bacterium]|nr:Asp-tRNA(Asn)/Glu-tRNA(Gln) amidotransferase subunit GatA [Dehalococcoidia bacterium]